MQAAVSQPSSSQASIIPAPLAASTFKPAFIAPKPAAPQADAPQAAARGRYAALGNVVPSQVSVPQPLSPGAAPQDPGIISSFKSALRQQNEGESPKPSKPAENRAPKNTEEPADGWSEEPVDADSREGKERKRKGANVVIQRVEVVELIVVKVPAPKPSPEFIMACEDGDQILRELQELEEELKREGGEPSPQKVARRQALLGRMRAIQQRAGMQARMQMGAAA